MYGCIIGDHVKIGTFVEIQKGVIIGCNVKISSHTFICEGVVIKDDVFIGHNVSFINDNYPVSVKDGQMTTDKDWTPEPIVIKRGASIGTSATILCGVTVGEGALIGAGSVVTRDVADHSIMAGNPARLLRNRHPEEF